MRIAAMAAFASLAKPAAADGTAVLEAIKPEVQHANDSAVFKAGIGAMGMLAKPSHLSAILELAGECKHSLMALRLLASCSGLPAAALRKQQGIISSHLCECLSSLDERDSELVAGLATLAGKIPMPTSFRAWQIAAPAAPWSMDGARWQQRPSGHMPRRRRMST